MYYTAFSLQRITPKAKPKIIATLCHAFGGCSCSDDCKCKSGKSCETCHFTHISQYHDTTMVDLPGAVITCITTRKGTVMQVDVYTDKQFGFTDLRVLVESLRQFTKTKHVMMLHTHRDFMTDEPTPGGLRS